jgi:hypothetical protein
MLLYRQTILSLVPWTFVCSAGSMASLLIRRRRWIHTDHLPTLIVKNRPVCEPKQNLPLCSLLLFARAIRWECPEAVEISPHPVNLLSSRCHAGHHVHLYSTMAMRWRYDWLIRDDTWLARWRLSCQTICIASVWSCRQGIFVRWLIGRRLQNEVRNRSAGSNPYLNRSG